MYDVWSVQLTFTTDTEGEVKKEIFVAGYLFYLDSRTYWCTNEKKWIFDI